MRWVVVATLSVLAVGRTYFKLRYHALWDSYTGMEPRCLVLYRTVVGAALGTAVALYVLDRDWTWMSHPTVGILRWLGLAAMWGGVAVVFWAHWSLGENFSPSVGKGRTLVTDGPYRWIRHPMYVGYIVLFAGVWLVTGQWVIALFAELILLSLVAWRLPIEERLLAERFGEGYQVYAQQTPRFFPGARSRKATPSKAPSGT